MLHYFLGNFTPEAWGFPASIWIVCFPGLLHDCHPGTSFIIFLESSFFCIRFSPFLWAYVFFLGLFLMISFNSFMRMDTSETHFLKTGMSANNFVHVLLTVWLENSRYKITFFQNLKEIALLSSNFHPALLLFVFILL